jgi:hypothetical protein
MLDGAPVAAWARECEFGILVAHAFRTLTILLSEADIYRITERGFQAVEKMWDVNNRNRLLRSRWRVFGLAHMLGVLKKHRLDLPQE